MSAPSPPTGREWHLVSPPARLAQARGLRAGRGRGPAARRGPGPGPQPVLLRRPVHARPDERREVVRRRPSSSARPWRAAPSARSSPPTPRASPSATTSCTSSAGASTPPCDAKHAAKVDADAAPLSAYLGVLGMTGLTAYAGLLRLASFKEGDAVFVSGAAGAVGSQVGQIAKLKGASRVIGSRRLRREGQAPRRGVRLRRRLQLQERPGRPSSSSEAAPDGIDVYFDNVGGDHLEAAIGSLNVHGRIAICGMISAVQQHRADPRPAQPRQAHRQAAAHRGLPRQRPPRPSAAVRPGGRAPGSAPASSSTARRSSRASRTAWRRSSACCAATTPAR